MADHVFLQLGQIGGKGLDAHLQTGEVFAAGRDATSH